MTGAIIGLAVGEPLIAVPAAIASHFVMDTVPHFGERTDSWTSPVFKILLLADVVLCPVLVLLIFLYKPKHWLLAIVCAAAASSVDFVLAKRYLRVIRGGKRGEAENAIEAFHNRIQWFQKPPGALVEVTWAIACVALLAHYL